MTLAHGGNVYEIASRLGCSPEEILDYSASINPLGPPPGLLQEFSTYFNRLEHYPDIGNRSLLEALSRFHGIPSDRIVVGNGSTELIYWLPKVLGIRKAAVVLPTFSEYQKAFELQGIQLQKLITSRDDDFQPSIENLEKICEAASPEAILLTHPGSPSGTLLPQSVRDWIVKQSRRKGILCIVDEVFIDFCEGESLKGFLEESPGLVLIRSMTKFYGVPGLRLGYLLTSGELSARMKNSLPPWSVSTLAQIGGVHVLGQETYRKATLELIQRERDVLLKRFEAIQGLRAFPGRANYLLVELDENLPPAAVLQQDLLNSHRILVRDCSSFEGLGDRYVRIAIRFPEQNARLMEGIEQWVDSQRR